MAPWVVESPVVRTVTVPPVVLIVRVVVPVAVGLVCATGGVAVQVVVRLGAPSWGLLAMRWVMGELRVV